MLRGQVHGADCAKGGPDLVREVRKAFPKEVMIDGDPRLSNQ